MRIPVRNPRPRSLAIACVTIVCLGTTAAAGPPAAAAPTHSDAECEVWARELGFARSVAEHDGAAFAAHVGEQAAFNSGQAAPLRGRDAIVDAWAGIIAGEPLKLSWYPARVTIAGADDVAASSGPALYESVGPDGAVRHRIGAFHSVWHRDDDGQWRVLFDDGIAPQPASDEQVAAFHAGRREDCPRGG
ncbi:DUF4440 domain-containing protein [Lysobacter maris]|uniref:DUF4440 domain-containing protein n=1 Tax=Marilutibacter maris TaxID=1605891 RepID=A0A508AS58_9GAMM|nr:DUF4440 domain-containing protein [Lysobacter maris]KAB8192111.1 DUF4440 domain-containing protein [Lysobacter maris]